MRTARLLPVSPSMHCAGWGGGAWSQGRSALGVGCLVHWGLVPGPGGMPASDPRGVPGPRGVVSQHAMGQTPPCEQNHRHV